MEEVNNPPHSMGSGQPHPHTVNHTRPFFYVQPPSQPCYMYQWHMNNPYSPYGFPGSALHFGRPYMAPYPYMQYPGYVMPHAPMQPIDHRRIFNPHFPSTANYDIRFRHHQTHVRRETACSGAQTDPSDAVNKLIESLEKLRHRGPVAEKELDSGIVSQGSGTFFMEGDSKRQERGEELEPPPAKSSSSSLLSVSEGTQSSKSASPFGSLPDASYKSELNQPCFDELVPQEGWSEGHDGDLPLDSSSIHEESASQKVEGDEEFALRCIPEKLLSTQTNGCGSGDDANNQVTCGLKVQCESTEGQHAGGMQDCEGPCKKPTSRSSLSPESPVTQLATWLAEEGARQQQGCCDVPEAPQTTSADAVGGKGHTPEKTPVESEDLPYRILRLPCDKVTTEGLLQKDDPFWYADPLSTLIAPHSYLPSFGNTAAYYYSYYPPTAQERQSVLSPSLDELSSRDEMFSTDLEDMDLVSGPVYTGGRLAEAPRGTPDSIRSQGRAKAGSSQKGCPICLKMKKCTTCGSSFSKEPKKSKACHSHAMYGHQQKDESDDEEVVEEEDEEDDVKTQRCVGETRKVTPKRQPHPRRSLQPPPPVRQPLKTKSNLGHCEHPSEPVFHEEAPDCQRMLGCCEEHKMMAKAERYKGQEPRSAQHRPLPDRQWRESSLASEQESRESCGAKLRPKTCKSCPPPGDEKPLRRTACKTFLCPRSRKTEDNEEAESPQCHRGRGSTNRRHKMEN